ncbi:MAG: DNA cytosine methyltransferase [Clostridia bacterium]|nr:DNA cytosine methyltransferase [Clostridia bacterium]
MKALDVFCGMGGWSEGFSKAGFEVRGIDIVNVGYPFDLILEDIRMLNGKNYTGYDIIVGSPPCRDFTKLARGIGKYTWKVKPDIDASLELVRHYLKFIIDAKPIFWLLENNPFLARYIGEPVVIARLAPTMVRAFWGSYPDFLIPMQNSRLQTEKVTGKLRSYKRAKIPICVSQALADAVKFELSENHS